MKKIICYVIISLLFVLFYILNSPYSHAQQEQKQVIDITPTDDAYVGTDRYDTQDTQGFEKVNTGTLPFLKTWYAWNVTNTGKQFVITVVYLKFDLTNITSDKIESASLNLYPFKISITNASRQVDVFSAVNSDWNETKIVYLNAPHFSTDQSSTLVVDTSDLNRYVKWDVTPQVKSHTGSYLTLVLVFHLNYLHNQELINFYSKDFTDPLKRPKLELVTIPQTSVPELISPGLLGGGNSTAGDSGYGYIISGIIGAAIGIVGFAIIKRRKKDLQSTGPKSNSDVKMATLQPTLTVPSTQDMVPCPGCKKPISTDYKLCPHCGLGLDRYMRCPYCGRLLLSIFRFCTNCGKDIG